VNVLEAAHLAGDDLQTWARVVAVAATKLLAPEASVSFSIVEATPGVAAPSVRSPIKSGRFCENCSFPPVARSLP